MSHDERSRRPSLTLRLVFLVFAIIVLALVWRSFWTSASFEAVYPDRGIELPALTRFVLHGGRFGRSGLASTLGVLLLAALVGLNFVGPRSRFGPGYCVGIAVGGCVWLVCFVQGISLPLLGDPECRIDEISPRRTKGRIVPFGRRFTSRS
jgi:hypothetical protein